MTYGRPADPRSVAGQGTPARPPGPDRHPQARHPRPLRDLRRPPPLLRPCRRPRSPARTPHLGETVEQWWNGLETYLTTGITKAAAEGNNCLIKLAARNAFDFRNRANQRLCSRCATTRRNRREARPH
ncbi:transposase [Streptomyces sp. NPDC020898]|uniref:transposase n=1 Tax=Streptomyces sp. NPDC020898 TaxID=3365101 RepID=UPI00379A2CFE